MWKGGDLRRRRALGLRREETLRPVNRLRGGAVGGDLDSGALGCGRSDPVLVPAGKLFFRDGTRGMEAHLRFSARELSINWRTDVAHHRPSLPSKKKNTGPATGRGRMWRWSTSLACRDLELKELPSSPSHLYCNQNYIKFSPKNFIAENIQLLCTQKNINKNLFPLKSKANKTLGLNPTATIGCGKVGFSPPPSIPRVRASNAPRIPQIGRHAR